MEFLVKVLSGNSRRKDLAKDAEDLHRAFKDNLDSVKKVVEKEGSEVGALMDLIYDSSFPEEQVFMKAPSLAKLKFNEELVSRVLSALDSRGVPVMAMMLDVIRKHGLDPISDAIIAVLELLAPLLESKMAPEFTTDDVVDEMDSGWHTPSNNASPLLNALASVTSSPRVSAASAGQSPLLPSVLFRRSFSDRSSYSQNELISKSASNPAAPRDLHSDKAAPKFGFVKNETSSSTPESPDIRRDKLLLSDSKVEQAGTTATRTDMEKPPKNEVDSVKNNWGLRGSVNWGDVVTEPIAGQMQLESEIPPLDRLLTDAVNDTSVKDLGLQDAQSFCKEDNIQADLPVDIRMTGANLPQHNNEKLHDSEVAQPDDELNLKPRHSEEIDLEATDMGSQDVHPSSEENLSSEADAALLKFPAGAVQPRPDGDIEKRELFDPERKRICPAMENDSRGKESSKEPNSSSYDVAAEQSAIILEIENFKSECDAEKIQEAPTSGLNKSNRIAGENFTPEPQHFEDGVLIIQDGEVPASDDLDEKPIAGVESGNEIDEEGVEDAFISGLNKYSPIVSEMPQLNEEGVVGIQDGESSGNEEFDEKTIATIRSGSRIEEAGAEDVFTSALDKPSPIVAEQSPVESQQTFEDIAGVQDVEAPGEKGLDEKPIARVESGNEVEQQICISDSKQSVPVRWLSNVESGMQIARSFDGGVDDASLRRAETREESIEQDIFDREQNFDRLSNDYSSAMPNAKGRSVEEELRGSRQHDLLPQESFGEATSTSADQSQDRSDREDIENCVERDDRERVGQALCPRGTDDRLPAECRTEPSASIIDQEERNVSFPPSREDNRIVSSSSAYEGQEHCSSTNPHSECKHGRTSRDYLAGEDGSSNQSLLNVPAAADSEIHRAPSAEAARQAGTVTVFPKQEVKALPQEGTDSDDEEKAETQTETFPAMINDGTLMVSRSLSSQSPQSAGKFDTEQLSNPQAGKLNGFAMTNARNVTSKRKTKSFLSKLRRCVCLAKPSTKP